MDVSELERQVCHGYGITPEEALLVMRHPSLEELCRAAHHITERCASKTFDRCSILNVRSGRCSEDCKWCAQSARYATGIEEHGVLSPAECVEAARKNGRQEVNRLSLVASGRCPSRAELDALCGCFARIHQETDIRLCASLGLVTEEQLGRLRQAGVSRYHCNLETAPSFFPNLCTTHTQEQKIKALRAARRAGMDICCGGIIGMGETGEQRVELAFALKDLEVQSIPLNLLHPIPGTPLAEMAPLSDENVLRTVAMFRFVCPSAYLRLAGGRARLGEETLRKAFYTGINAAIMGDMLTTTGSSVARDCRLIKEAGYEL